MTYRPPFARMKQIRSTNLRVTEAEPEVVVAPVAPVTVQPASVDEALAEVAPPPEPVVVSEPVVVPEPEPVVVPEPEPLVVPEPEPVVVPEPEITPEVPVAAESAEPEIVAPDEGSVEPKKRGGFPRKNAEKVQ